MNARYPETSAQLFDLLHEFFGLGDYDDGAKPDTPWFKVRMNEIGKLNGIIRARGIELKTLAITAHYCHDQGIPIRVSGDLLKHITAALVDMRANEQTAKAQSLVDRINHAAEVAQMKGQSETAERILRMPVAFAAVEIDNIERSLGIS